MPHDPEVHRVLVKARNGVARDGWNNRIYGLVDSCGTPRCALGWTGWACGVNELDVMRGVAGFGMHGEPVAIPSTYRGALEALRQARPEGSLSHSAKAYALPLQVEQIALGLADADVLPWFDRAIATTAPEPADPLAQESDWLDFSAEAVSMP